ncbi:hypothetical protein AB9K32_16485 [Allomuricauda sp. XS_ASV26]|jgi:hypothetical protein|uniref:hypothetical protein n=1 Tax=Flavobacteriaceae TaxID=49546 RepID=UPI0020750A79|nr:hypothetical protein [Allomuricauda aquimarina]USD26119.1 hypothetical protein MJO53_04325 [Allomuricauda aquimarina]
MTYKTKSLVYFICFVAASALYYLVEQNDKFQETITSETYAETNFQDTGDFDDDTNKNLEEELR